jgi:hypothetical protein
MRIQFTPVVPLWAVIAGAVVLAGVARADHRHGGKTTTCPPACLPPPCPTPQVPEKPSEPGKPGEPPPEPRPAPPLPEPTLPTERSAALGGGTVAIATPPMQGHQLGIPSFAFGRRPALPGQPTQPGQTGRPLPGQPGSGLSPSGLPRPFGEEPRSSILVPTVRSFKISENESPRPLDRVFVTFNYYDHVNNAVNQRLGVDVRDVRVYREAFGFEKTFLDGDVSLELRLPVNSLSAESGFVDLDGTDTGVGDLTTVLKAALWQDRESGDVFSVGLAVTAPTGPDDFANSDAITSLHSTILSPFAGYIWNFDRVYLHGFLSAEVPTDSDDVTALHNDVALGYYLHRDRQGSRFITAIVPTFEVHVTTPLNHRGATNFIDPAGTADVVDLTMGTTFEMNGRSTLAVGLVTPVTGPRPYEFEVLVQLNVGFGGGGTVLGR